MDNTISRNSLLKCMGAAVILGMLIAGIPSQATANQELEEPKIRATSAVLIDGASGRVLYDKEKDLKRAPASLTKMMTAILAIEMGLPNEIVTVSSHGAGNKVGSDMGLNRGDQLTLRDLTKAALIVSANDAALVIAEHIGGSEEKFLELMNKKARTIGAMNTSFKNTNGYSEPEHYSTAYDMALIARYALNNVGFAAIVNTSETEISWHNRDRTLTLINSNRLQRQHEWITGVKTGTANTAGKCLAASGEIEGQTLIAVVLNSSNRYGEALSLLEYGFSLQKKVVTKGQRLDKVEIKNGEPDQVGIVALEDVFLNIKEEELQSLEINILYHDEELALLPLMRHHPVGVGEVVLAGEIIAKFSVGVDDYVEKKSIF